MKNWLSRILFPKPVEKADSAAPDLLALQNELQTLRLELDNRERAIANLKQEIERQRSRQDQMVEETVSARLTGLFSDVAAPASQIMTQVDLFENQNKTIQAGDILPVAKRILRALERYGLAFEGQPGQKALYDPNYHTPLNANRSFQAGEPVTVRFAGASYQGKIIFKAVVE